MGSSFKGSYDAAIGGVIGLKVKADSGLNADTDSFLKFWHLVCRHSVRFWTEWRQGNVNHFF